MRLSIVDNRETNRIYLCTYQHRHPDANVITFFHRHLGARHHDGLHRQARLIDRFRQNV